MAKEAGERKGTGVWLESRGKDETDCRNRISKRWMRAEHPL